MNAEFTNAIRAASTAAANCQTAVTLCQFESAGAILSGASVVRILGEAMDLATSREKFSDLKASAAATRAQHYVKDLAYRVEYARRKLEDDIERIKAAEAEINAANERLCAAINAEDEREREAYK